MIRRNGFTDETLEWRSWLRPLQLADRLTGLLYAEDIEFHFARMEAFDEPEILGDEWVAEPLPSPPSH